MADRHRTIHLLVYLVFAGFTMCCASRPISRYDFSCDMAPQKKIDTALVTINTEHVHNHNVTLTVKALSSQCHKCKLQTLGKVSVHQYKSCAVLVDTRWETKMAITSKAGIMAEDCRLSSLSSQFIEHGEYQLTLTSANGKISCGKPVLLNTPTDSNMSLYLAAIGITSIILVWNFLQYQRNNEDIQETEENFTSVVTAPIQKSTQKPSTPVREYNLRSRKVVSPVTPVNFKADEEEEQTPKTSKSTANKKTKPLNIKAEPVAEKERLRSLDTFRGICVAMMVFVNYGAGEYWFLNHMVWNGLTVADFIMPWFVWIMGTSLAFTIHSQQLKLYIPRCSVIWKIFKRSAILFCLGLIFNADGYLGHKTSGFRIPGVLQRYALTYFLAGTLKMMFGSPEELRKPTQIRGISGLELTAYLSPVLIWVLVTFYLPVPGCPTGYLGPGGLAWDWNNKTNVSQCTGGAAMYIDHQVFGADHIFQTPTCQEIYQTTVAYDPEGLLGTLTSCFLCILGMQAGLTILIHRKPEDRLARFFQFALATGIVGVLLCQGSMNDGFIPINKNLWSLSFILVSASTAFFMFAVCYLLVDVRNVWSGWPFYQPGMNPILLYMGHELINQPVKRFLGALPNSHLAALGLNLADTAVWLWLGHYLHHHGIFISI